jgi:hypothetical protein
VAAGSAVKACPRCPKSARGKPVSVTTGSMFFTHTDAVVGELAFSRTFDSARVANQRFGSFGPGWNASFEARLVIRTGFPKTVEARTFEGDAQYYYDPDGDGTFDSVLPYSTESHLQRTAEGYRRTFRAGARRATTPPAGCSPLRIASPWPPPTPVTRRDASRP